MTARMSRLSRPPVDPRGDTESCPLLGMCIGPSGIVRGMSRPAVALIKEVVRQDIAGGEAVIMEVVNP